jgi:hypothetical protein
LSRTLRRAHLSRLLVAGALIVVLGRGAFAAEADTTAVMSKRPRPTASAPT